MSNAGMMESVVLAVSKTAAERRVGSSPTSRTEDLDEVLSDVSKQVMHSLNFVREYVTTRDHGMVTIYSMSQCKYCDKQMPSHETEDHNCVRMRAAKRYAEIMYTIKGKINAIQR